MKLRYLLLALTALAFSTVASAMPTDPNPCGNHGNNCNPNPPASNGGNSSSSSNATGVGVGVGVGIGTGGSASVENTNTNVAQGGQGGTGIGLGGSASQGQLQGQTQDQHQGQSQANSNYSETNTSTATSTNTATNQTQSASANNTGNAQSTNVTYNEAKAPDRVRVDQAPSMLVSAPYATASCYKTGGGALSSWFGGASFSGGKIDQNCEYRELARVSAAIDPEAGKRVLCLSEAYQLANTDQCAGIPLLYLLTPAQRRTIVRPAGQ